MEENIRSFEGGDLSLTKKRSNIRDEHKNLRASFICEFWNFVLAYLIFFPCKFQDLFLSQTDEFCFNLRISKNALISPTLYFLLFFFCKPTIALIHIT